ncbi:restriction endonuclease subunit S [Cytophaga aurantiaca]|uniref:restriction endonuclease subunit S n=1 Tax=Cytophaga aurantiaca TaxID=29530 RepID=UPI00036C3A06|nr:restriction endonuclease subunit S [Cytophaga aurantiaca]
MKNKHIPELRFPEFKKDGEWEKEVLGDISEIVRGGSPRPIQDYQTTDIDGLNWLKIADVSSESKYIISTKEKVIVEALSSTREVNPGDLILSNSMSFGRPYILKIKTCIHDGWIAIRKISKKTFEDYLYYFISSESSQSYFQTNAAGAAVKNLNAEIIKLLPVYLPKNKKEQQKIASCLSWLDEVISVHSQKLESLKDHKKGLMQNLFPQEGETVPKWRFKEFAKDREWETKTIGEIAKVTTGNKDTQNKVDNGLYPFFVRSQTVERINSYSYDGEAILTSGDGVGVGKNFHYIVGKFDFHQRVYSIYNFSEKTYGKFVYMYFSQYFNERVMRMSAKNSVDSVRMSMISDMPIILPKKNEQVKIAECLSSLDELIIEQTDKLEALKLHKKGLMQALFPKVID